MVYVFHTICPLCVFCNFPIRIAVCDFDRNDSTKHSRHIYSVTPCYRANERHTVVFKSVVPNLSVVLRISSNFVFMARSGEIDGYAGSRITCMGGNRSREQAFGKQYIDQWI